MIRASVIIPTYNRAGVVSESIRSALSQTVRNIEVIVVDDGSTDSTPDVVQSICDPRVRYIRQENDGPASARNLGIAAATGEYLAFLDSDDQWPANYLETMIAALSHSQGYGLAYSSITVVYLDRHRVPSYKGHKCRSGRLSLELFKGSFVWSSAVVLKACSLDGILFDENLRDGSEDSDFYLRLSLKTQYLYVRQVEALRIISSDSLSLTSGLPLARLLVLERFYRCWGRDIPAMTVGRRLGHSCKKLADGFLGRGCRSAALAMYKRALQYWPCDVRLYIGMARAAMLRASNDPQPDWQMPPLLGEPTACDRKMATSAAM